MEIRTAVLFAMLPICLYAQEGQDHIQVSVTQSMQLKPEEAIYSINVLAPLGTPFETVLRAVTGIGVKETDLAGISQSYGPPIGIPTVPVVNRMNYTFNYRTPYADMAAALQRIDQARRALLAGDTGMELTGAVIGLGASEKARADARTQLTADAIAWAKVRAAELARAAGLTLGKLVGVDEAQTYYSGVAGPGLTEGVSLIARFAVAP